ncbi:uncharacterized protein LOC656855 isoform X1 [Tribolium castaneum]|uniref:Cadherin domain-containing protein n=1 Tax=Tribolium castaneum TaxID=7070 RepID=A0A139WHG6_TRICA|nr:PREDICTED: uncharacterized protein LOC656855 isoform X1 [Tribolium castaneum]KYB27440.1 hypothetical protein TcasGA2_TC033254 [Tribolium castaneum]|eukprot:XP_008194071.1 PREDICTED: uncharacterized protein LOC656855 isoform X1 [Tribolium castaneum]
MKFKTFLFVISFVVPECFSQDSQKCQNQVIDNDKGPNIDWTNHLIKLENESDDRPVNLVFKYTGELSVTFSDEPEFGAKYIDIVAENNQLSFKSNDNYTKIEEDPNIQSYVIGNTISFQRKFTLNCDAEQDILNLLINIKDTNNHDPTFAKTSYSYEMPMPLIPNIDLTGFGDDIIVTDYDFTNDNVAFTIDNTAFEVTTKHNNGSNSYTAVVKVKSYTYLSKDTQLTLTATDSGEPPRSSSTTIQIKIDESNSLPDIPSVPEASYQFDYAIGDDKKPELTPLGADIIVTASDSSKLTVKLESSDIAPDDYFTVELDKNSQKVTIKPTDKVIEASPNPVLVLTLVLTLNGKEKDSSKTAILVNLPTEKIITIPQFGQAYYEAQYIVNDDKDTVELSTDITVSENAEVTLVDDEKHFSISKVGDKWQVTVLADLDSSDLKKGDIPLELQATVVVDKESYVGFATLIVNLPQVDLRFTKPYYTATYTVSEGDALDTLAVDGDIALTSPSGDVTVELVDNQDYFTLSYIASSGTCTVEVKADLDQPTLHKGGDLIVNFKATLNGVEELGALVITLPDVVDAKFVDSNYVANYVITTDGVTVNINGAPISVKPPKPSSQDITVSFKQVNDNFKIVKNVDQYLISVTTPLNASDLLTREPKVFTLQTNTVPVATSTLVIELPDVRPKFTKTSYDATYKVDAAGSATVELKDTIELITILTPKLTFTGSFGDHFSFDPDKDPQISVTTNLDEDVVKTNPEILLTLQATIEGSSETETTIIVLKLPNDGTTDTLQFEQPSYVFSYKTGQDKPYIDNGGQSISLVKVHTDAEITITGTFSENFELSGTDNQFSLGIKTPLNQTVLDTEPDILLVLDASLAGLDDGFATILLHLPEKKSPNGPKFAQAFFTANYELGADRHDKVTIDGKAISLADGTTEANIEPVGTNSEHFKIEKKSDGSGYELSLVSNLDDSVLIGEADVVLTLKATLGGDVGEGTLVVKLPKKTAPASFKQPNYVAKYNMDTDPHTIDMDGIELEGDYLDDTVITLKVDDGLEDYFTINDKSPYKIALTKNLDDTVLNSQHEVVVTVVATLDKTSTTTSVIVTIPDLPTPPNFKASVYYGKYDSDKKVVTLDDPIETDAKDSSIVHITAEKPYDTNFAVEYDKTNGFAVKVTQPLDDETVQNNNEIFVVFDATVDRAVAHTSATLVLKMPTELNQIVPKFSEAFYNAQLDEKTVTIKSPITITSDKAGDTQVEVIDDYKEYFGAEFDGTSWQLTVVKELETALTEIVVTLEASLPGDDIKTTTTVIMALPDHGLTPSPKFTVPLYEAEYVDDEPPSLKITDPITLQAGFKDATVTVGSNDYQQYFKLAQNKDNALQWDISLSKPLTDDILKNNAQLVVTLKADLENSEGPEFATLVIKLPAQSQETVSFGESYYTADYTVEKDKDKINSSEITVSEGATVTVIKEYTDYFGVSCADKKCVLTVKKNLEDDVLNTKNEIIVVLQATKTDVAEKPTVPVIVSLPLQDSIEAPKFEQIVYTADYDKESSTISANSIKFKDTETKGITVAIDPTSDYKNNFKVTSKTDHWEVEVSQALDVSGKVSISFILQATKEGVQTMGEAVFVVNLPANEDTSVVEFSRVTYTGKYNVKDTTDEVVLEQNIQIKGISDTSKAKLIIEGGSNKDNFEIKASEEQKDQWIIGVKTDLPNEILDTETSIVLTLQATVNETSSSGEVGVVINLPKAYTPTSFYFTSTSYTADYEIKNNSPELKVDSKISIENDPDSTATTVKLSGDFAKYFAADYSKGIVTITLSKAIPNEIVEKQSALPVTIEAAKKDNQVARAVLVVRLPKETSQNDDDDSSDDQTGLIAAVAVLAVLLVASLVGSAVFYYFKFKTAKNYSNMSDSPRPSERFRKNSAGLDTKHKFEHATRRPTGVIKYPLKDDESTDCVEEPISEKRKSVQFDVIHIDELEIEPEKTDDEDNENVYENVDSDSDHRRNSEA